MRVFGIYLALIAGAAVWNSGVGGAEWIACFAGGLALWTLLEYFIHRFAFHRLAPHFQHHEFPDDRRYIYAPLWFSLGSAAGLFAILGLAARSWQRGALIEAGAMTGYLLYEGLHLWMHSPRSGGAVLIALRRHHFYHHFADDTKCFGVVTPFWDRVFGSSVPDEAEQSPRRRGVAH